MKIFALVSTVLLLQANGCHRSQAPTVDASQKPIPYQRFVPVPAPQAGMMGVPWTGYFALDTKTGQLCLTSDFYAPEAFKKLPNCMVLKMDYPDNK